jgi:hypothetical protein
LKKKPTRKESRSKMIDKEMLLKAKKNLERLAEIFDRTVKESKEDQEYNELMLTLVNNELQLIEEEDKEKFVPWREQMAARHRRVAEKKRKDRQYNRIKETMIEDGLGDKFLKTEHLVREMVYTPEEHNAKELKRYTAALGKAKATAKDEGGKND